MPTIPKAAVSMLVGASFADQSNAADSYISHTKARSQAADLAELEQFATNFQSGIESTPTNPSYEDIATGEYAPRRKTTDDLGRLPATGESMAGKIMNNVAEIPTGAARGVHDAVLNATAFIEPLSDWLDENVADLSYTLEGPQTVTGQVTKSITQFLTGFIPAMKAMKAYSTVSAVPSAVIAGAVSDFATRDPHEGRLADLWNEAKLPKNILTDYLASDKEDDVIEARFKNALESAALGTAVEGIFLGARAIKAARKTTKAKHTEESHLKAVYGEVSDEDIARIVGDPSKPAIQTKIIQPPKIAGKIEKGMEETADITPSAMVRKIPRAKQAAAKPVQPVQTIDDLAAQVNIESGHDLFTNSALKARYGSDKAIAIREAILDHSVGGADDLPEESFKILNDAFIDGTALKAPTDSVVYRSINLKEGKIGELVDAINSGKSVSFPASTPNTFASSSLDVEVGSEFGNIRFDIKLPKDAPYIPAGVKPAGGIDAEKEILLDIGTELKLTSVRREVVGGKDKTVFTAEYVKSDHFKPTKAAKSSEAWYHGTDETFDLTSIRDSDTGIWFYDSELPAKSFGSQVHKAEVSMDNPLKMTMDEWENMPFDADTTVGAVDPKFLDWIAGTKAAGHDGVVIKGDAHKMAVVFDKAKVKPPAAGVADPNFPKTGLKSDDFETYINFGRIDTPEQVKFTIGKLAEGLKGSVDEARRGVITQEQTAKMADDLGMTVSDLLQRRKGQPFNAEEALAARQLWTASGEALLETAKKAAGANAGALDHFAFRKAMAIHAAIQNEVIGARTETARALASWAIPAGGKMEKARAIDQVMQTMGGPEASKEMARRLAILAESGASPAAIARFVQRGWGAKSMDVVKEVWINGLLSSPKTHVVNIASNSLVAMQSVYERAAAAGISKITGSEGVQLGEAAAMAYGLVSSTKEAFIMAAKALRTGETGWAFNKIDVTHPNSISAEAFNMAKDSSTGRFVDFLGHTATVPGRLLGAEDEFFKTIGYRMEVNAQALRQAKSEGLKGADLHKRITELKANPPEHIRINAADAAMYNTFTNAMGKFGQAALNLRNVDSPMNSLFLVVPFVRTPVNIARYTFERTPFAPLVGQWRADIAAGGARADLALARMSTGTAIMMTAMDYASDGLVSGQGPQDKTVREALVRSGWQPYSVKVGDRWVSYNRMDPFGSTMGFAASITEAIQDGEIDEEDVDEWQEVTAMAIASVAQVTINKTYLEGMASFVETMSDPKRYSESYVNDLVASFVPMASLMNSIKGFDDPIYRDSSTPAEAIQARIIGLSKDLPPRRDLWGAPLSNESGLGRLYDAVSPVVSRKQEVEPVDREIARLGRGPERIKKRTTFDGVNVSLKKYPAVYDDYVRLAGNDLKHPAWGLGAKDFLNAVVAGKHPMSSAYQIMSDSARRDFVSSTVADYRKFAQQQILSDPKYAAFARDVQSIKSLKQQSKMPVLTGE